MRIHSGKCCTVPAKIHHSTHLLLKIPVTQFKQEAADFLPGAPHGLTATHQDQVNADLLAFIKQQPAKRRDTGMDKEISARM